MAVHSASTEEEALAALPKSGYAKLNSGLYYPVSFAWTLDGSYNGADLAENAYTAKVTADDCPIALADVAGSVTIEANAFVGYYTAAQDGNKVSFAVDAAHGSWNRPPWESCPQPPLRCTLTARPMKLRFPGSLTPL